jgi:hypothetical protein
MLAPVLAVAVLAAAPAEAATKDFDTARVAAESADADYRKKLVALLSQESVYARHEALLRFDAQPELVTLDLTGALVALLADTRPVYPRDCLGADEKYASSMGQGEIYDAAQCIRYRATTNARAAEHLVSRLPPTPELLGRLLDAGAKLPAQARELVDLDAPRGTPSDPLQRILKAWKFVPAEPFLARLAAATTAPQRLELLGLMLRIHDAGRAATAPAPLPALLADADVRTSARAALVTLLLTARDDASPTRKKAIEVLVRALSLPDTPDQNLGEAVAADVSAVGVEAVPLLKVLTQRLDGRPAYRGWTLTALAGLGPAAAPALPVLLKRLARADGNDVADVLDAIAALGPAGRSASHAIVDALGTGDSALEPVAATLDAVQASVTAEDWKRLATRYTKDCSEAGAIAFFSLSRDDRCARVEQHLKAVAERSHQHLPGSDAP